MSSIKIYENKTKRKGGTHIWICVMMEHCQLLLGYLAGFLLKVKNTVECILDLIQKRKKWFGDMVDIRDKNV